MSRNAISFRKMQGLGNDFIIIDQRDFATIDISTIDYARLADRYYGIGCDQIIMLSAVSGSLGEEADIMMQIFNADSSEVDACGNATRCVGKMLLDETGKQFVSIHTNAGILRASYAQGDEITVTLAPPMFEWQQIPLTEAMETLAISLHVGELHAPTAISVGNPHAVFFVENVETVILEELGPQIEHHYLFPERTNVEIVEIVNETHLKMRVWERGAGLTNACGTGACATLVAAVRRGLVARKARIEMPGGSLLVEWQEESEGGYLLMTGDAQEVYRGMFDLSYFLA